MGPTQRHMQWILLDKASGMWSWLSSFEIKNEWSSSCTPLCIFMAWTETALQNACRAGQIRANYENYETWCLEKVDLTQDTFKRKKKTYIMPCLMCVFVCRFMYLFYLFVYSFVRFTIHLLLDWFNGWLLISSPINTELINFTKEKSALGRPSGRCESNNKTHVRIGYMQVWTGYSRLIQPRLQQTGITWPGICRYLDVLYQVKKKKALCGDHVRPVSP